MGFFVFGRDQGIIGMFLAYLFLQLRGKTKVQAQSIKGPNGRIEIGRNMDKKRTILVVDDNPDVVTIVKEILNSGEFEVQCASNGKEVFSRLEEHKPDLIILDIMMPQMDGLEVLTRLKGAHETSSIPVILLTAKGQYRDVLLGYQLGTDYYLSKPFTGTQLINGVNLVLGSGNP